MDKPAVDIMWFRRDLRLEDNVALYNALNSGRPVLPIFIFDTEILDQLENKYDRRVDFIFKALEDINKKLHLLGSGIQYHFGKPIEIFDHICNIYDINEVYANGDYEPYGIARDAEVKLFLNKNGIPFNTYKDQVIFEKNEILKADGKPYTIYSPYAKVWHEKYSAKPQKGFSSEDNLNNLLKFKPKNFSLEHIGFQKTDLDFRPFEFNEELLKTYARKRNMPALDATSRISIHLRFGTVSIRSAVRLALEKSFKFYRELIWRDFFMQLIFHFPQTRLKAFKPGYDNVEWKNDESDFERWKSGTTGFALVDAGMRELNETGFMHNRVRMITASFLIKDLLIDWRWGEAYFAEKLLDYDLAQNVGNWQWCAGSGCDAAPYFRVFNPDLQLEKFDAKQEYVKKWVPEFGTPAYPQRMLDHKMARLEMIDRFKKALVK